MPAILPLISNKLAYPGGRAALNLAHPAAQNCVVAAVTAASPSSGLMATMVNVVNGKSGTASATGGVVQQTQMFGNLGPTLFDPNPSSSQTDIVTFPGQFKTGSLGVTMAVIFAVQANLNNGNTTYLMTDAGTTANQAIGTGLTGSWDTLQAFVNSVGIDTGLPINGQSGPFGVPYFAALSSTSSGIQVAVLRNLRTGRVYTYGPVNSGASPTVGDGSIWINSRNGARNWNGWIAAASYSNTALNLQQLKQWAEDPWALWYG